MVSVDSWEYPADFLIINPKNRLDGHPLILARPWLAISDAYIGCQQGNMTITRGANMKNLALYPPAQPSVTIIKTNKHPISYLTDNIRSPLTIKEALDFKDQTEDDAINNFISQAKTRSHIQCHMIEATFDNQLEDDPLKDTHEQTIPTTSVSNSKIVEIDSGKTLNINANLASEQEEKLIQLLRKYKEEFAWDYPDMKGIDPQLSTHHIYIEKDARPVHQPQRRLNPHLKDVVKAELQKLLDVNFIYPISDRLEVYMDDFTPYGDDFDPALDTLEKVLQRCIATRLCLSHEKCYMMMTEELILGHYISAAGIQVDPAKIQIILLIPTPTTQTEEFDITIKDRPGKENSIADFLSRMSKPMDTAAVEDQFPNENLFVVTIKTPWYADVANYLAIGKLPKHLTPNERKQIVQRSARFSWIGGYLFHTRADMHIRRCVREDEIFDILKACHVEPCGGHFAYRRTGHKVLQTGYYWPTIFKDAKKFVQACDSCQRAGRPSQSDEIPLNPQLVIEPFERWALDFVGPINPSSNQKTYILVATEYVTKWVEAEALPRATEDFVIQFLFHIFVHYGLPRDIITDGGPQFAEAILTKTIASHRRDWAARLPEALWAYRTTWRSTTAYSPYQLVFGKEPIFPIDFEIQTLRIAQEVGLDLNEAQINRLRQFNELDEIRLSALQNTTLIQEQRAKCHDALIKKKFFREGDWALLYDSRFQDFPGKLQTRWLGPYEIQKVHDNGTLTLSIIDGSRYSFKANSHRVRLYRKPLTRESFYQQLRKDSDMQIMEEEEKYFSLVIH
eukprot:PITA_25276